MGLMCSGNFSEFYSELKEKLHLNLSFLHTTVCKKAKKKFQNAIYLE